MPLTATAVYRLGTHDDTDIECVLYFMRCRFGQSILFQLSTSEIHEREFIYARFDFLCFAKGMSAF